MIMKNKILLCLSIVVIIAYGCGNQSGKNKNEITGTDTTEKTLIKISGSETFYPVLLKLISFYSKEKTNVKFDIKSTCSTNGLKELKAGNTDIAMSSVIVDDSNWTVPVALDVVVPIISFDNPVIQAIVMNGLTKLELKDIFTGKLNNWGKFSKTNVNQDIEVFVLPDSSGTTATWLSFLEIDNGKTLKGEVVKGGKQMYEKVKNTDNGIGFCSASELYYFDNDMRKEGIYILPVDFNSNGIIDDNEQHFDNYKMLRNALTNGFIAFPPARYLSLVLKSKPQDGPVKDFIKWILTIGQNYIYESGYVNLSDKSALTSLNDLEK